MTVDTLKFRNALVDGELNEKQATAIVHGLTEYVLPDLATKADIERLFNRLLMAMLVVAGLAVGIAKALPS